MDERKIVKNIRELRLRKKFTLQKLADEAGLTKSYLSMIESGKKSPPIATLSKIAGAMDVDITDFFHQKNPEDHITLVRKGGREVIAAHGTDFGYHYESIAPAKRQKMMEPFVITHPIKTPQTWLDHEGEELLFVLEGEYKFYYDKNEYLLKKGDCVYFDSSIPHKGEAYGNKPAKTLVVISQSKKFFS
jgi:transcriptional regulator with XRE-family HTH domain